MRLFLTFFLLMHPTCFGSPFQSLNFFFPIIKIPLSCFPTNVYPQYNYSIAVSLNLILELRVPLPLGKNLTLNPLFFGQCIADSQDWLFSPTLRHCTSSLSYVREGPPLDAFFILAFFYAVYSEWGRSTLFYPTRIFLPFLLFVGSTTP